MHSYKNHNILITGASSGIGKSLAFAAAKRGAHLFLVARREDELSKIAEKIKKDFSVQVFIKAIDLTLPESSEEIFKWVQSKNLHLHLLINNAGFGKMGSFGEMPIEDVESMIQLNILSLATLTRLFLPELIKNKPSGVINIASTAAFVPVTYMSLYAATKAFVKSFTEALWSEYKSRGVQFFCLCPGNTHTEFHEIAGISRGKVFLASDPDRVAEYTLNRFLKVSGPTSVYKFVNRMAAIVASRLFPVRFSLWATRKIYSKNG